VRTRRTCDGAQLTFGTRCAVGVRALRAVLGLRQLWRQIVAIMLLLAVGCLAAYFLFRQVRGYHRALPFRKGVLVRTAICSCCLAA
jgi:hypothetical protein